MLTTMIDNFLITHYIKDSPSRDGWKKMMFITWKDENYYHSFSGHLISEEKITNEEEEGSIFRLKTPLIITTAQSVWLSDDGKVYIASSNNPFSDDVLIQLDSNFEKDIYSVNNIQKTLSKMWTDAQDNSSLDMLIDSPEWQTVIQTLKIQILSRKGRSLPEWIYKLLCRYDQKYGKLFYKYCSELYLKTDLSELSLTVIDNADGYINFLLKANEEDVLDHYSKTSYAANINH
jgi:hypothetical protein